MEELASPRNFQTASINNEGRSRHASIRIKDTPNNNIDHLSRSSGMECNTPQKKNKTKYGGNQQHNNVNMLGPCVPQSSRNYTSHVNSCMPDSPNEAAWPIT